MSFTFNPFTGNFDYFDNLLPKDNTWTGANTFNAGITIASASSEILFNDVDQRIHYNDGVREVLFYPYDIGLGGTLIDAKDNFWLFVDSTYVAEIKATSVTFQKQVIGNDAITFSGLGTFGGLIINGVGNPAGITNVDAQFCYGSTADSTLVNFTTTSGSFATDAVSPAVKFSYNATGIGFYGTSPIAKPGATTDLGTVLSNLGLRTAGTAYPITTSGTVLISSNNHINFRDANTYINSPLADTLNVNGNTGLNLQIAASSKMQITSSQCTFADAFNFVFNTVTGTKFGTGTTQKIGFFNATPVAQQSASGDLGTILSNLGLKASGATYTFNTSGTATFGTTTVGDFTANSLSTTSTKVQITDGSNLQLGTTTGTKIGSATNQKIGFYNSTPVIQQTDGAALTNNVTSGGTTNQIDNFTDLVTYANDAAAIRNDIYQLARKLKIVDDALRTYGLLS